VYLDRERTLDKACLLIEEAGRGGANLAVFPEAFVPGYPVWVWFIPPGRTADLREAYVALHANALTILHAERIVSASRLGSGDSNIDGHGPAHERQEPGEINGLPGWTVVDELTTAQFRD
jgi:predicted amidohydrolase